MFQNNLHGFWTAPPSKMNQFHEWAQRRRPLSLPDVISSGMLSRKSNPLFPHCGFSQDSHTSSQRLRAPLAGPLSILLSTDCLATGLAHRKSTTRRCAMNSYFIQSPNRIQSQDKMGKCDPSMAKGYGACWLTKMLRRLAGLREEGSQEEERGSGHVLWCKRLSLQRTVPIFPSSLPTPTHTGIYVQVVGS